MIAEVRNRFNISFSEEKYEAFKKNLNESYQSEITFRIAETPIFIPKTFQNKLLEACQDIIAVIQKPHFKELTEEAIPPIHRVPNEDEHTTFLAIDFAVCKDENGEFMPQLIEMQGFPSLYGYQIFLAEKYKQFFDIPENFSYILDGMDSDAYFDLLKKTILGTHKPENVILLEIEPHHQKTNIDFYVTQDKVGIQPVCISEIIKEGEQLFYMREGIKTPIYRIYNRLIFDEFERRTDLKCQFNMIEPVKVEWAGHPNWFFRISKYALPFLHSPFVPETHFLHTIPTIPTDLENYVLKPLFSFAGAGVKFDLTPEDIAQIPQNERRNFILQRKVQYTDAVFDLNNEPIKAEIRMLFLWESGNDSPRLVTALGRLSKGKMIGVDFNKNKTWVGGTAVFFE